jgi:predicted secreted protein
MAQAQTLRFGQFLIEIGDGAQPEVFTAPCGFTSRGFERTAATNDTNVPDCDDPDAASWLQRDVVSLSGSLSGSGVVADEDFDTWDTWLGDASRNVRITLGTRRWIGPMHLTSLSITGEKGKRVDFSAKLESDGEIVRQA